MDSTDHFSPRCCSSPDGTAKNWSPCPFLEDSHAVDYNLFGLPHTYRAPTTCAKPSTCGRTSVCIDAQSASPLGSARKITSCRCFDSWPMGCSSGMTLCNITSRHFCSFVKRNTTHSSEERVLLQQSGPLDMKWFSMERKPSVIKRLDKMSAWKGYDIDSDRLALFSRG